MRFAFLLVITTVLSCAYAERADACGTWTLEDRERAVSVVFHASTVSLRSKRDGERHIIRIDDDGTAESVRSVPWGWQKHTPPPLEHTFANEALLHRGKQVGVVGDGAFTIHGRSYVVTTQEVAPDVPPNDGPFDDVAWIVEVTRDGVLVLSGLGRTICADYDESVDIDNDNDKDKPGEWRGKAKVKLTDALKRDIMLRRIAVYLAATRAPRAP